VDVSQKGAFIIAMKKFQEQFIKLMKGWPGDLVELLKNPRTAIPSIPEKGSYRIPLIYTATAGAGMGIVISLFLLLPFLASLSTILYFMIVTPIGVAFGAFLLHLLLSVLGKEPGYYKTFTGLSILSFLLPIQAFGRGVFAPNALIIWAIMLYFVYFYALIAAKCTKKKAKWLVIALAVIPVLLSFGVLNSVFVVGDLLSRH